MRIPYIIPKKHREEIIRKSIELADHVHVDELDCSKSFCSRDTDKTIEEVIKIGLKDKRTLFNFVLRNDLCNYEPYYDAGLSTMTDPSYFLWIKLSESRGNKLILEYNLKEM